MRTLIRNVEIVDATGSRFGKVLIENGKIKKVYKEKGNVKSAYDQEIDGQGFVLMPGFIDMHCHLRDPGYEYKETMETGMAAALKGGYTTLVAMANTNPVIDNAVVLKANLDKAEALDQCTLIQVSAVTKDFGDSELVEFETVRPLTRVFSNDGVSILNPEIMIQGLKASTKLDFLLLTHCQPETALVQRDIALLEENGGHLHVCHISKKDTLDLIREAKKKDLDISCEVTPHHIFASAMDYKVNPPFRTYPDRRALIDGIKDGVIDICGTDHAPHSEEDKLKGAPGINNFEMAFAMYHTVFEQNGIELEKLSEMMSDAPAKRLGLKAGLIKERYPADLVLVDLKWEGKINPKDFISKSKNNPFGGETLKGKVLMTMVKGEVKYDVNGPAL
ncbi:dihydroorotase [Acetobacterium woodii]|uniref:Dihydroorotase, multifunctional complex type n=1 Tax=Acetobacterium woodii (strain ATCC 29683 / DSM 1030 / JCM 2381 / KCTC 1655 / WB1) TaxID=931626 RepID=H6LH61_ACEWD|nr:dihydroorotase [Acetobacterium woodii]AFA48399.1 dihydroorotase, multifunctional complex type [Acetobacterium woodii DSM 1030]